MRLVFDNLLYVGFFSKVILSILQNMPVLNENVVYLLLSEVHSNYCERVGLFKANFWLDYFALFFYILLYA